MFQLDLKVKQAYLFALRFKIDLLINCGPLIIKEATSSTTHHRVPLFIRITDLLHHKHFIHQVLIHFILKTIHFSFHLFILFPLLLNLIYFMYYPLVHSIVPIHLNYFTFIRLFNNFNLKLLPYLHHICLDLHKHVINY